MLLNGGGFEGAYFLSPRTVSYMTTDHLPPGTAISPRVQGFGSHSQPGFRASLWPRFRGSHGCRAQSDAGLGRRILLDGRVRDDLLGGPERELIPVMMVQVPINQGILSLAYLKYGLSSRHQVTGLSAVIRSQLPISTRKTWLPIVVAGCAA